MEILLRMYTRKSCNFGFQQFLFLQFLHLLGSPAAAPCLRDKSRSREELVGRFSSFVAILLLCNPTQIQDSS